MLKKRMLMQAAALFMSATVISPTMYPAVSVYAAEDTSDVTTEETTGGDTTPEGEGVGDDTVVGMNEQTDGEAGEGNGEGDEGVKPEGTISVFYNGDMEPVFVEEGTMLQDFVSGMLDDLGIQFTDFRLDMVDETGMRTRLTGSDDALESPINTVSDLYGLVQTKNSIGVVAFNDVQELGRFAVNTSQEEDALVVDATTETSYKVIFQGNGGVLETETVLFRAAGEAVSYIETSASYDDNHIFAGWYDAEEGGNEVTEATLIYDDMTVYAHWSTAEHQLIFDSQGGSAVEPITGSVDDTVSDFSVPTRDGYIFVGWYDAAEGGNLVNEVSLETDVTLYAHWKAADYQITFDTQGGSAVTPVTGSVENGITDLQTPTREGYTFAGWYDAAEGGNKMVEPIYPDRDLMLYAHWEPITYRLSFSTQGGSTVDTITGTVEDTITDLPTPKKEGYTFLGWYDAAEGGNQVTSVKLDKDTTLYAQWKEAAYVVTLDDRNGNVTTVKGIIGKTFTDFPTPSRNGYAFLGWYTDKEGGNRVTSYRGDKDVTFYAHWEKLSADETNGNTNENGNSNDTNDVNNAIQSNTEDNEQEAETYILTVVSATGSIQEVSVKDTVQLDALAEKLGYQVSSYTLKTVTENERVIDNTTTMKEIAEKAESGEVLIIGFDNENRAIGSAKVTKTGENAYKVTLSKDTNVTLRTQDEVEQDGDTSGKGEGEQTVSQEGKSDGVAEPVQTSDSMALWIYGGLAGVVAVLSGLLVYFRRKKLL